MKIKTWFFVFDGDGVRLAAFPNEELAHSYSENTGWEVRAVEIVMID